MWKSFAFLPDSDKENSFQASFPYTYTPDQDEVIWEILDDMDLKIVNDFVTSDVNGQQRVITQRLKTLMDRVSYYDVHTTKSRIELGLVFIDEDI